MSAIGSAVLSMALLAWSVNGSGPVRGAEVAQSGVGQSSVIRVGADRFTARLSAEPALRSAGGEQRAELDSVLACYPQMVPNWTGNIQLQNSVYTKNSGDLYFRGGQASSHDRRQAWAKFDLSVIPENATITDAYLAYYCYQIGEMPTTDVTLVRSDPVPASASTLYNEICTGTVVSPVYAHGQGWQFRQLNASGVAAVQSRLGQDWVALGVHEGENNRNAWGYACGFTGGAGGMYKPYLSLDFSLPVVVDVSMEDVIAPSGVVTPGTSVYPCGRWRNRQAQATNFTAYFFLMDRLGTRQYAQAILVSGLGANRDTTLVFPISAPLNDTGVWTSRCSTYAAGDVEPTNDTRQEQFRVGASGQGEPGQVEMAVVEIQSPSQWVDTGSVVTPTARWRNNGVIPAVFTAHFYLIDPAGERVYAQNQTVVGLAADEDTVLSFADFAVGTTTGAWMARCSTEAYNDTVFADDTADFAFNVYAGTPPWVPGWHEVRPMPAASSQKAVKDGGWLTIDPETELLYAAKGNKTGDFYVYEPTGDSWRQLALWPTGTEQKSPQKGSVGVADGQGHVFATKGGNTLGFWRYHIAGDSWHPMPPVLLGNGKRVKGGNDLAYVEYGGTTALYMLKGYKNEFQRFSFATDTWERLPDAPVGGNPKWDKGSWLVYDGLRYLYAHKAKYHELWRYDLLVGAWDTATLTGMPIASRTGKSKKSKEGGCGAADGQFVYALKGGNTGQFYRYSIAADSWHELDTMPAYGSTAKKRRVKAGGDMVRYADRFLFALKGNKTRELWYYYEPPVFGHDRPERGGVMSDRGSGQAAVRVRPSPVQGTRFRVDCGPDAGRRVSVAVFDAVGRCVARRSADGPRAQFDLTGLTGGVYLLRIQTERQAATAKLVVD